MTHFGQIIVAVALFGVAGCGGGTSSVNTPLPSAGSAQVSVSLHDSFPTGVTVLSFQATVTGISMQPGNVSLLNSPVTLEMTQLQAMSAYLGTISVPAGSYTGMTITLSNAQMTFLNNTGTTVGGMMGGGTCASGQVCSLSPTMMASSLDITGSPFPLTVQANTPFGLDMDFDLMDSLQSNMSMSPVMTSMMQGIAPSSGMLDEMDDILGQVASVDAANNQFRISLVQGMTAMTLAVDSNTTFEQFGSIGKTNSLSGLSQGQTVLVKMQLMGGGSLRAETVRFESNNAQVMDGMIVAIGSPTQFDMVVIREATALQGAAIGQLMRINLKAGTSFDVDDMDLPVSGMNFASTSDLIAGQVVQIEPESGSVAGTPPQLSTNHVRLMKTWISAAVASSIDPNTFTVKNLPTMFGSEGIQTMKISTSMQTEFENVSSAAALNASDAVSVRGPLFSVNGVRMLIASKVEKR
jgi:hypothetical protein